MASKAGKILLVDDNEDLLKAARLFLKRHFAQVDIEKSPERLPGLLAQEQYDVILLDMNFTRDVSSGSEGFYWLDRILQLDPAAVVVLITAYGDVSQAVRAIKEGATDFVLKPWENDKLIGTLLSAMRLRESRLENQSLRSRQELLTADLDQPYQDIIGQSPAMLRLYETIRLVAKTDANILILGENGTGKELVARAIHRASHRAKEVFVGVDMGAISETLFESELFGHAKGAFTDAKEDRAGRFEGASGGTLFLDEIGNLSLSLQAKLLTVLQSRQVTRVGTNKPRPVDVRLICATNTPLAELSQSARFRQDLLYRINTISIELPALRERPEDIELLAHHYLHHYAHKYNRAITGLSPALLKRLQKYHWPGNVRELQHAMERAVILSQGNTLEPHDFFFSQPGSERREETLGLEDYNLEAVEKIVIKRVLKKHSGNISYAAEELGLTRASLYRRLEKYGL